MKPIIRVENLSKQYRIGAAQTPYKTLRESLTEAVRAPFSRFRSDGNSADNTVWALKDVSFKVMPGEIVGIIGRNGAGKSTLLKILSRITEPTRGKVDLYGRVGSLLEVGTGFHSELSGRENIYLNGAILGMRRGDIERKFDQITEFAEVGKFLDTPVKHYSSGMYTRLAFSVAAHLEPEVLVVDEVLAVGDAAFQKKCLGKMEEVARQGRTVLFCSHNMAAIRSLCSRGILLEKGRIDYQGSVTTCIDRYLADVTHNSSDEIDLTSAARPSVADTRLRIDRVRIISESRRPLVRAGDPFEFELFFSVLEPIKEVVVGLAIQSADGVQVFECRNSQSSGAIAHLEPGEYRITCRIVQNCLRPGTYLLSVGGRCASRFLDYVPNVMAFEVYSDNAIGSLWMEDVGGLIYTPSVWKGPEVSPASQPSIRQALDIIHPAL